jgi:hypothetical protein
MSVTVIIDKEKKLAICAAYGVVTNGDGPEMQRQLAAHPDFDPRFSQLLDMTQVIKLEIDADVVRKLAESTVFDPAARRAFVADSDAVYGFSRMFEILLETTGAGGIKVFRSREEALRWLEQDLPDSAESSGP